MIILLGYRQMSYFIILAMNERVAELMRSRGLHKNISEDCQHRMEMLADLIIEECANLFSLTFTDEQYQRRIDKTIRKHFGLE